MTTGGTNTARIGVVNYDLTGSKTLAGLSAACLSIGASIGSFPLARYMARSGRRPGLRTGPHDHHQRPLRPRHGRRTYAQ